MGRAAAYNGLRSDLFWLAESGGSRLPQSSLDELLIQADFGRRTRGRWPLLIASHARWIQLFFVAGLLLFHLPLVAAKLPIFVALGLYVVYLLLKPRLSAFLDERFPSPDLQAVTQLCFALVLLVCVTVLLVVLTSAGGSIGVLWLLYVPALAPISFSGRQLHYAGAVLAAVVATSGLHLVELQADGLPATQLVGEVGGRAFALLAMSFLVHYFVRGAMLFEQGATIRATLQQQLMERLLVETNPLALWWEIRRACAIAINAIQSELYVYEYDAKKKGKRERQLRRVTVDSASEAGKESYRLDRPALRYTAANAHIAIRAVRDNEVVDCLIGDGLFEVAAPIYGHPRGKSIPLAVVLLRFEAQNEHDKKAAIMSLGDFMAQIWPIATYASIRFSGQHVHRLRRDEVLNNALDTICDKLGFEFATISLVDEDRQEIRCVAGRNVPDGWIEDARHPLNPPEGEPPDIQAKVIRIGKTERCGPGWHENFDRRMYEKHGHEDLIRVFLPLGGPDGIGTIEAGVRKSESGDLRDLQVAALERYGRLNVTVALQNALLHERVQRAVDDRNRLISGLNQLHRVIYDWQTDPAQLDDVGRLAQIAEAACEAFGADLAMVYALEPSDFRKPENFLFRRPVYYPLDALRGSKEPRLPSGSENIVHRIATAGRPHYSPNTTDDPWLKGYAGASSFTSRQKVRSFAGVPLLVRGEPLGVLCLNFRTPHAFAPSDRHLIELFAQQAASMIASHHMVRDIVRSYEREQFERFLHDGVETNVHALDRYFTLAFDTLRLDAVITSHDVKLVRSYLSQARHITAAILFGVELIYRNVAALSESGANHSMTELLQMAVNGFTNPEIAASSNGAEVVVDIDRQLPTCPLRTGIAAMFIVHQAVCNALRYANANAIHVNVRCDDATLFITVRDDGDGFDPTVLLDPEHRGLKNMRRYAELVWGGKLEIDSRLRQSGEEHGTTIRATIPLDGSHEGQQASVPVALFG